MCIDLIPTPEEARRIAGKIPIDFLYAARDIYRHEATRRLLQGEQERNWIHCTALHSVFVAGYITGIRHERRKKRLKGESRSF